MTDYKIRRIDKNMEEYPERLREIEDAPKEIYCIGNISLLSTRSIAVVGSRKCSEYGKRTAMNIGRAAATYEITIVSGMAKGIDSFAHLGTLKNGGKTIAVLGCGADVCYPAENKELYEKIAKSGLIVSEYEPGSPPLPYKFPLRNRIISALSEAVTVVEAGTNSGALITAEIAANQGREVFAVPGNINSRYSLGTNKLIADGARAVALIDDIFCGMGMPVRVTAEETEKLGEDEIKVYELVKQEGEISVEEVCTRLNQNPIFVNGIVTVLEMKGLVAYTFGKIFIAKF